MEERRSARVGTVIGLALLAGGTALAAVAGGAHSVFATVLLALLTIGLCHSLLVEIRRQAGRRSAGGWARHDTVNAVVLAVCSEIALLMTIIGTGPVAVRAVGLALSLGYAGCSGYFVTERRRAIAALPVAVPPVTAMPVTAMPVTAMPVTAMPVTAMPVTAMPVTAMPVAAMPVAAIPVAPTGPDAARTASDQPERVAEGRGAALIR